MTKVISTITEMKQVRHLLQGSVGFVPTMGALHAGHESLLKLARLQNDYVVLSIFVNRTQFNDPQDFAKYPSTFEQDLAMAQKNKVDFIFYPNYSEMYPDDYRYKLSENNFSQILCGANRPGHFDGVLSVVMKLFNITSPRKAYFGEKDFQQLNLIQGMIDAFFMDIKLVPVSTMRETDGLAMSSRNTRLKTDERKLAPLIYQTISTAASSDQATKILNDHGFRVDYVQDLELKEGKRRFVAAYLGEVRLIDNVKI